MGLKRMTVAASMCASMALSGCGEENGLSSKVVAPRMDDTGVTAEGIRSAVDANNTFALELYRELRAEPGNVFLSPYSISTALAMTYEGARGETATEMQQVLHFPTDDAARRAAYAALHNRLNPEEPTYDLRTANALWAQKDYAFLPDYANTLGSYYAARAENVDFVTATEEARETINGWVEEQTNDRIKDLFPRGSLNEYTRLVLTNAVYFKGTWLRQFDKALTRNEDFRAASGETVSVPMMRKTGDKAVFDYYADATAQVLSMPYEGERLSMRLVLPVGDLSDLESMVTPEALATWSEELREQRVDVFVPRFKLETKYPLNGTLQSMGMPTAFSDAADFSGMDGTTNLAIQQVIHQAFVEVNEEGTEAAAATGVSVGVTSINPNLPVFRADRPFLFYIQDEETGTILFLGRVAKP